ncbi:response regulator [Vibrio algicola]|uniref:Response regulator n=1 Tax=Vibrio algicola TaxID=2662262 RepID=A0A5Q0TJG9_9VIBR|nr:response regulator [Vibrio algicola]
MDKLHIVCVDENVEITFKLLHDLAPLSDLVTVHQYNSADKALSGIKELDKHGEFVAVVVSNIITCSESGAPLLEVIADDPDFRFTKRVLITDNPSKDVLSHAINVAHISRFYEFDWDAEVLLQQARSLVTKYVFAKGLDYHKYQALLDYETILKRMRRNG